MNKRALSCAAVGGAVFVAASGAVGQVTGVHWKTIDSTHYELFAAVGDQSTRVLGGELNPAAQPGPPTGLYSTGGTILGTSSVALGNAAVTFAIPLSIQPSGSGSVLQATWFTLGTPTVGSVMTDDGAFFAVLLASIGVETPGTALGGTMGGPGGNLVSQISVGWVIPGAGRGEGESAIFAIPRVPGPTVLALAAVALTAAGLRTRRRI